MKKKIINYLYASFFLGLLISVTSCFSNEEKYPQGFKIYTREGYTILYSGRDKLPLWVFERLTSQTLERTTQRGNRNFTEDIEIPSLHRVREADYHLAAKNFSFDKGHMAAATNHENSLRAMDQSFLYTNACPQHSSCNRGVWKQLELSIKNDLVLYPIIDVISGPLFFSENRGEKKYVTYQVLGQNEIAVPTHFFKVVYYRDLQEKLQKLLCYIIPNNATVLGKNHDAFQENIEKIEKISGLIFAKD